MRKINIVSIGKLSPEVAVIVKDYANRIRKHTELNEIVIREASYLNSSQQVKKETDLILEKVKDHKNVYLCAPSGKTYDSISFSRLFFADEITFIIGGSHGLDSTRFEKHISFSMLTFPHQMFKMIALEQIYRALTIVKGTTYHK